MSTDRPPAPVNQNLLMPTLLPTVEKPNPAPMAYTPPGDEPDRPTDELTRLFADAFRPSRPETEPEKTDPRELPAWANELECWWTSTASSDIAGSIDKIAQYGGRGAAYDLIATGHDLAALNSREVDDEEATELAVVFYLSSKINRMLAAAIDGRRGSDDTLLDISYYAFMARRNRAVGGWPVGTNKETPTCL